MTYLGTTLLGQKRARRGAGWHLVRGVGRSRRYRTFPGQRQTAGVLIWLTAIFRGLTAPPVHGRTLSGPETGGKTNRSTAPGSAIESLANFSFLPPNGYQSGYCHMSWAMCSFFDLPGFADMQLAKGGGSDQDVLRE